MLNSDDDWRPKVVNGWVPFQYRTPLNKILFILLKLVKLAFNSVYFYFFPFLCIILNIIARKCSSIPNIGIDETNVVVEPLCETVNYFYFGKILTHGSSLFGNREL
jgi:hypothetical protein